MSNNDFLPGKCVFTVEEKTEDQILSLELNLNDWDDGYLAFSSQEIRLKEVINWNSDIISHLSKKFEAKGYLMEINLWRHRDNCFEEISIEREDYYFLYQRWELITNLEKDDKVNNPEKDNKFNCYYRSVNTLSRKNALHRKNILHFSDDELRALEVIVFDKRLHFFITQGVK